MGNIVFKDEPKPKKEVRKEMKEAKEEKKEKLKEEEVFVDLSNTSASDTGWKDVVNDFKNESSYPKITNQVRTRIWNSSLPVDFDGYGVFTGESTSVKIPQELNDDVMERQERIVGSAYSELLKSKRIYQKEFKKLMGLYKNFGVPYKEKNE